MLRLGLGLLALSFTASIGLADDMKIATPDSLKWGPAPAALPKGAQLAVLAGDPTGQGPYVVRVKLPAGYQVPAHNHPTRKTSRSCPEPSTSAWATSSTRSTARR